MSLKKITQKLGQVTTFTYVILYLLMILLFAVLYFFLPSRSFYHSTSKYEYSTLNQEANDILNDLKNLIVGNLTKDENIYTIEKDSFLIDYDQIQFYSLDVDKFPRNIKFKMGVMLYQQIDTNVVQYVLKPNIEMGMQQKIIIGDEVICPLTLEESIIGIKGLKQIKSSNILFPDSNGIHLENTNPTIRIPISMYDEIVSFGQAYRGFPDNISGHWLRSLYLSSGISTSTVFGDIVPLSNTSRILVTIQGLISIILISLFFNAIAYDISNLNLVESAPNENVKEEEKEQDEIIKEEIYKK